jgi:hypothetical protein
MNSSDAVRSLVRDLLYETGAIGTRTSTTLHLHLSGSRRPRQPPARNLVGRTEARKLELGHVDLQKGGTNGGSGDAKSTRTLARQHTTTADGHAQAARNSRAPDVIAAHRDAEDLHRLAAGHYHNAPPAANGQNSAGGKPTDRIRLAAGVEIVTPLTVSGDA